MTTQEPQKANLTCIIFATAGMLLALCALCVGASSMLRTAGLLPTETPSPLPTQSWKLISTAIPTSEQPVVSSPTRVSAPIKIPTQKSIAHIGEMVEQGGYQLTVTNVEFADSYNSFYKADAGNHFLSVEILIQSNAPSDVDVNPFYVKVKDSDGYEYSVSAFGKDPSLLSQNNLPQGEKMRGWVTFQVPISAHGLILSYEPLSFTSTVRILVDLGQ